MLMRVRDAYCYPFIESAKLLSTTNYHTYSKRYVAVPVEVHLTNALRINHQRADRPQRVAQRWIIDRIDLHTPNVSLVAVSFDGVPVSVSAEVDLSDLMLLSVSLHVAWSIVSNYRGYFAVQHSDVQGVPFKSPFST